MRAKESILEFYKLYPIDHWIYKVNMLENIINNYDSVKKILHENLIDVIDKDCVNMLKAEIHFTYFQIIEALFELIFALEKRKDKFLWFLLSFSNYRRNFRRIKKIGNGDVSFLNKNIKLPFGKTIPLIQYIFYFGTEFPISELGMKENLKVITDALIIFAKDFSDRFDYNAYKHSLRFYQTPIELEIGELSNNERVPFFKFNSENTLAYLAKDNRGNIESRFKAFDPKRDFNMIDLCHKLISNIINLRKRFFFTPNENARAYMFNKLDLNSLNKKNYTLIELKSTILWKK